MPTPEATVFSWTPEDRRRIDGPFCAVHGGLRVTRRLFHDEGLTACPPRCFVCLRAAPVPDLQDLDDRDDVGEHVAPVAAARPPAPASALLAYVWVDPLDGPGDRPLDEEVVLVLPDRRLAVLTPLERVPDTLSLLAAAGPREPQPSCTGCGAVLPGSAAQRAERERKAPQSSSTTSGAWSDGLVPLR